MTLKAALAATRAGLAAVPGIAHVTQVKTGGLPGGAVTAVVGIGSGMEATPDDRGRAFTASIDVFLVSDATTMAEAEDNMADAMSGLAAHAQTEEARTLGGTARRAVWGATDAPDLVTDGSRYQLQATMEIEAVIPIPEGGENG